MENQYFIYAPDGLLRGTIFLSEAEAAEQERITPKAPPDPPAGMAPYFVGNAWVIRPVEVRTATVSELRASAYPPVEEQLDMLWHAMASGEVPVAAGFFNSIQNVKDRYPKPERVIDVGPMPE